jgi:hypothetical protein
MAVIKTEYRLRKVNGEYVQDVTGPIACNQYNVDGTAIRYFHTRLLFDLDENAYYLTLRKEIVDEGGEWAKAEIEGKKIKIQVASPNSYVNASGEDVEKTEAIELVNNFDIEIMDVTDPHNPIPFVPKRYEQMEQLKAGYSSEADYFVNLLAASMHPLMRNSIQEFFDSTLN